MLMGILPYETENLTPFAGRYQTADGYPVLAGGLCAAGRAGECRRALSGINRLRFGSGRDCVVVDACLARLLKRAAPPGVRYLAASISVPGAPDLCGGVAGDIVCDEDSAEGALARLAGVYGFALPGAGAMLMTGARAEARRLYETALQALAPLPLTKGRIARFFERASGFPGQFLLVTDGSGGSCGCMGIRTADSSAIMWLPPSKNDPTKGGKQRV